MMQEKSAESARGTVYYWIDRNENKGAKCIVFTHGLTANHIMFEKQVEYFIKDYTVITWDVPLHGKSRQYSDFSYAHTAEDLNAILEAEGIEKVVLVGMSMGGYPSQEFAERYSDKVLGFAALDTTPFGLGYYSTSDQWWLKRVDKMANWYSEKTLRKSMAKSVSKTKYAYELMMKMLEPLSKAEIVEQMGISYRGFLKENKDVRFDFPVLILVGEYDKTGKVKQYCEEWAKKEGYPLRVIKDAAHFANADNPDDVNEAIEEFVSGLE